MTTLLLLVLAADPAPCVTLDELEAQLKAVRAPLPELEGPYVSDEGRRVLRAYQSFDPKALEALYQAKVEGRARAAAFLATLAKDSELLPHFERDLLFWVDAELKQLEWFRVAFDAAHVAKAKRLKPDDIAKLWAPEEEQVRNSLNDLLEPYPNSSATAPVVTWFGLGLKSGCPPDLTAVGMLDHSGRLASGWRDLMQGLDLVQLAKLTTKVKLVKATEITVGCGPIRRKPKLRYDAKTLTVDYDDIHHEQCLSDKVAGQLALPMGGHGFATPRRPPPKVPDSEWKALRDRLLGATD
jgi:hypothetical protein